MANDIGEKAFMGCVRLKKASLPQIKKLTAKLFENCHSLKEVDIPHVEEIEPRGFKECGNLEKLELPSIKKIATTAFYGCWKDLKVYQNNSAEPMKITGKYDAKPGL